MQVVKIAYPKFQPEKIYVKNINLQAGISQGIVTDLVQDKMGFIWASTFDGLNRFDGQNLKIYHHNPEDTFSLPSAKIYRVTCDEDNHLYLVTNIGFLIFDCTTDRCIKPVGMNHSQIQWLTSAGKGNMWAYDVNQGLLNFNTRAFNVLNISGSSQYRIKYPVLDMYTIDNTVVVLSVRGEVLTYQINERKFQYYQMPQMSIIYSGSGLDKYGNVLIGSKDTHLICFKTYTGKYEVSELYSKNKQLLNVKDIVYDPVVDVLYLACYGQGLFVYDYQSNSMEHYRKNDRRLKLSSNFLYSLFRSSNGSLALGYNGSGLDLLDMHIRQFETIKKDDPDDLKSLRFVKRIVEGDNHDLLIGTYGNGLVKYNRISGQFSFYNMQNTAHLPDNFILEMVRVKDELWMGFNGRGLGVMDIHTGRMKRNFRVGNEDNYISDGTIWSMIEDRRHTIWVGTENNGLNHVNPTTGSVKQYNSTQFPAFRNNGIGCLYMLNENDMLLGTENGVYHFSIIDEKLQKVFPVSERDALSFSAIKCIVQDKQGRIWIGSDGSGIVVLDKQYKMIRNFNAENALSNGVIHCLLPQNDSTFWFSSNNGISRFVWRESSLKLGSLLDIGNYEEVNGLQSRKFNSNAFALLSDGYMAFGGLDGINVFNPSDISTNQILPKVYISDFKVFENEYNGGSNVSYLDHLHLKYSENSISITFSTLGFVLPEKTKYQYRMIGHENRWIQSGNRNYISYTNLPPGDYEFQVKACNYDGIWNKKYTSLQIHIATPYYLTWWFILSGVIFTIGLVYMLYRYRIKQIKVREKLRMSYSKELAEVEMKALRAQINPHFLFNTLNSINNYILKNDTNKASRYLINFSQLVRSILNNSSNSYITLQEELQTIELYLQIEGMRFNEQFSYKIVNRNEVNTANIIIPSLLLQPYVENAIWHGLLPKDGVKEITILIESNDAEDAVIVNIIDNGVGIVKAKEKANQPEDRKSYGMQLGEDRLKLMNQNKTKSAEVGVIDLIDEKGEACGTQIRISIPIPLFSTDDNINQ